MSKPTELKIASDIIRRVLDAAERGDIELLNNIRQATRKKAADVKSSPPKQEVLEYGRFGSKFTEEEMLGEIDKFDNVDKLTDHLRNKYPTRSDIEAVSRSIRVSVAKNLDYEAVISRIVDATLGYKLRSKTVRGPLPEKKDRDS